MWSMTSKLDAPPVVMAALAQHELQPGQLRSFEMTAHDVYLYLNSGMVIRVEINSLPEAVVRGSESLSTAQTVGDAGESTRIYLPGLPERVHIALQRAGYDAESLRLASLADLEAVAGIGRATARKIREAFEEWDT